MTLADATAVAALAIALVAALVAFAQVAQQYIGTANLLQKCDSVVYGPLPGRGRREFYLRQLRFKVVYCVPQISISEDLWPNRTNQSPLYSDATEKLAPTVRKHDPQPSTGEASWVSFYKAVESSCEAEIRYQLLEGDADHCPAEFPVVPMQVSMRDIIVLAIMSGMRVTDASFSRKVLMMQGPPGTISSAAHPMLGTIIHFTPRNLSGNHGVTVTGKISRSWVQRLWGDCTVAGTTISPFERDHMEFSDGKWSKRILNYASRAWYAQETHSRSGPDHQDAQIIRYSSGYHDSRIREQRGPASIEHTKERHLDARVKSRTGNIRPMLLPQVSREESQQAIVPWRKPWPRLESKSSDDEDKYLSVGFLTERLGHSQPPRDYENEDGFVPPEAPMPSPYERFAASISHGAHDGVWSFSTKPDPSIILIPTQSEQQAPKLHRTSWVRRIYSQMFPASVSDEQEAFLQPVQSKPHFGWEVCEYVHLDPCNVPLPKDSSHASLSSEGLASGAPKVAEPMFPPDFLLYAKNIGRKEGPHSVGIDRWYAAVVQQKRRREVHAEEMEDLNLINHSQASFGQSTHTGFNRREAKPGPSSSTNNRQSSSGQLAIKHQSSRSQSVVGEPSAKFAVLDESDDLANYPRPEDENQSNWQRSGDHFGKQKLLKDRPPNRTAFVESADEEEDPWTDGMASDYSSSFIMEEEGNGSDRGKEVAVPRYRVEDTEERQENSQRARKGKKRETSSERKIRQAQETAEAYRRKAERPIREEREYFRRAFFREQTRQHRISQDQKNAEKRQYQRDEERRVRLEARARAANHPMINERRSGLDISWFWVSQMDVIPGYCATPWAGQFSLHVTTGIVAVVLEALLGFMDRDSLQYSWSHSQGVWNWLQAEKSTFPPYARNGRGGVVVAGNYQAVTLDAFDQKLPPLRLLHCYDYQVDRYPRIDDISSLNRQLELMTIDSWLSIVGRTPEITNGPANLLRTAPALIEKLMLEFGWKFGDLDFYANEGGLQVIQDIAATLMDALGDESLTEAEQVFILVALMRTAKVALVILLGPSTEAIQGLLAVDSQVHLV